MEYTKENGQYFKVVEDGHVTMIAEMQNASRLSTEKDVIFITEEEYMSLVSEKTLKNTESKVESFNR
ncbi:hypothetical protein I6H88_10135 [Elizabethkingia bruuniana]|uniref:Uncharacterized protein n=1 Tax=Elizabethkingia bruuniana TaxID=1756149 RepID=A0A7T7V307_9FLAO|nr:hypothetical protein [Elizabethkingia bruuniana]KGO09347.1 hypothetical protein KS04_14995 [Elizabethkingia miricola]AQX87166.1 hypothetical protein AYC65_20130 [Elizabethkingia bruuniana]KUY23879.1 hypothetical protein ATB97_10915 [Elizabethkingia bruuniana]OPB61529.1 hypothetical protein BAY12_13705 [Elizabethkingia bruuniana]QDZ63744.1 hypothetical protein EVD20_15875 [Elizabethkingia bruuniana]